MTDNRIFNISGAGPAGLAAATFIQQHGGQARVYERRKDVGGRFHGDFQGLENWTSRVDVLHELQSLGIAINFDARPFHRVTCFDPDGVAHHFQAEQPLFYLVRRGAEDGTLDSGLKQQALAAGVDIRFNTSIQSMPHGGIITHGPQRADVIAAGYLFETDMPDGAWAAVSDELAPEGYAYVLVDQGRGTLATCMYADFHRQREYVARCVKFFEQHIQLDMQQLRRFGGAGNAVIHRRVHKGNILYAGEAAGFQDALFGFGIRWAVLSGALAAEALLHAAPKQYESALNSRIRKHMRVSEVNRWIYRRLGNRGYRSILKRHHQQDARLWLQRGYRSRWWTPLAHALLAKPKSKPFLQLRKGCDCVWCKCQQQAHGH